MWTEGAFGLYQDPGQYHTPGYRLYERLKNKRVLNATVLEYLYRTPRLIPASWKCNEAGETIFVHFWGTQFRDPHGNRWVKYLFFNEDERAWDWSMSPLTTSHHGGDSYAAILL